MHIVAIAPKLKIVGERTINLNGSNAKDLTTKATDGRFGIPGNPGVAGFPGGPGGIFYAFANVIENADSLIVSANGGSGGRGQDGGNGGTGYDGTPPDVKKLPEIAGFGKSWSNCKAPRRVCNYTGADGYPGGNGGHGGMGGKGGKAGIIFLYQLNQNSGKINKQFSLDGKEGLQGRGGKGGHGGKNGGYVEVPCCGPNRTGFQPSTSSKIQWGSEFAPDGENGIDGGSSKNLEEPEQFLGFLEFPLVVHEYKQFLQSHWSDESRKKKLINFYYKLTSSQEINKRYGTLGLLDALKGLEENNLMNYVDAGILEYRNYKDQIESKIREASSLMKSEIRVEVDKIDDELKDILYQLINETMVLKDVAVKRREALQNAIYHLYLKTAVKMGVTGATVLVPGGQLIGPAALTAVQVGESLSKFNDTKPPELTIPKAVDRDYKEALELKSDYRQNELKLIDEEVHSVNQEKKEPLGKNLINLVPDHLNNVFSIFNNKEKITDSNKNQLGPFKHNSEDKAKFETGVFATEMLNNLKVLSNPLNLSMDTFYPAGDEKDKVIQLRNNIVKVNNDLEQLGVYQNEIFSILIPLLQKMKNDLPSENKLSQQSVAALDVSKWRAKTSIKKMRRFLKKFTEGFEVADDMNLLMERLDETIGILINIHRRIQSYRQEKQLVNYVTSTVVNSTLLLTKMKNLNEFPPLA